MAEQGEYGGPSFGGVGAYGGGLSEEEEKYSNAIARNILGISTRPSTYGAPLDSPEAANYGFGLGSNLVSISPNLPQYAQPFLNPSTGLAQMEPGFFDFSGDVGSAKAQSLGLGVDLGKLGAMQVANEIAKEALRAKGIDPDDVDYQDATINLNFPSIIGKKMSPVAYGTKQQQQEVLESLYDNRQISLPTAITYAGLVNHMNPALGQLNVDQNNLDIKSYIEGVESNLDSMGTEVTFDDNSPYTNPFAGGTEPNLTFDDNSPYGVQQEIAPFGINTENINWDFDLLDFLDPKKSKYDYFEPSIELIDPVNTTPTVSPAGNAILDYFGIDTKRATPQEDTNDLMNDVLGLDLSQMDQDVLGLDRAMASTDEYPWENVISNISFEDVKSEYDARQSIQDALAATIAAPPSAPAPASSPAPSPPSPKQQLNMARVLATAVPPPTPTLTAPSHEVYQPSTPAETLRNFQWEPLNTPSLASERAKVLARAISPVPSDPRGFEGVDFFAR